MRKQKGTARILAFILCLFMVICSIDLSTLEVQAVSNGYDVTHLLGYPWETDTSGIRHQVNYDGNSNTYTVYLDANSNCYITNTVITGKSDYNNRDWNLKIVGWDFNTGVAKTIFIDCGFEANSSMSWSDSTGDGLNDRAMLQVVNGCTLTLDHVWVNGCASTLTDNLIFVGSTVGQPATSYASSANLYLYNSGAYNCGGNGIAVENNSYVYAKDSVIRANGQAGLYLAKTSTARINNCTFDETVGWAAIGVNTRRNDYAASLFIEANCNISGNVALNGYQSYIYTGTDVNSTSLSISVQNTFDKRLLVWSDNASEKNYVTVSTSGAVKCTGSWICKKADGSNQNTGTNDNWTSICTGHTLTLNHNGGTYNGATSNDYTVAYSYDYYNNISWGIPTRTGHTFAGWYTSATGGTPVFDSNGYAIQYQGSATYWTGGSSWSSDWMGGCYYDWNNMVWNTHSGATLYAHWNINSYRQIVKVRYENVDGTFTDYSNEIDTYYNYGSTVSWSRAADSTYQAASITSYTVTGAKTTEVTVYRKRYTLEFVAGNGVASVPEKQTGIIAGTVVSKTCTAKTGYHLTKYTGTTSDGSSTNGVWTDCSGQSSNTTTWTMYADRKITVHAEANTYYVNYYKGLTNNGGTTNKTAHTFDSDVTLASNGFTGRSYALYFNENKPKDAYNNVTSGTVSNLQGTKSGKLSFKNWYITDAHNNNNTYASANTNLGKKNYRNDNGGSASATAQWNSVTLNNFSSPSLTGYTFNGYYTAASGGTKTTSITVNPSTTAYSNTLYAQWKANKYTLTFKLNKPSSMTSTITGVADGTQHTVTYDSADYWDVSGEKPSATGWKFTGWYTSASGGTQVYDANGHAVKGTAYWKDTGNGTWCYTGNVTLYAHWQANTYYVNYYKGLTNNGGNTAKTTHTYDADVTLALNGFTGMNYSLSFNANKPKDDYGNVTAGAVTNLQSTKSGNLSFKNWYITDAHNNNNTYASANTNLGKKNYRTDNGGTASATAQWNSVTLNNFSSASLTGYKFNGYYTAASGGTKTTSVTVSPSTTAYSNTLYAQWTPITYKIRFNGNGNWNTSQGSYTQTITYDKHTALNDCKFTRADATTYNSVYYERGYEFIGWGTSNNQKTPTYTNKQTVCNLTATDGKVIDLYALWKKDITLTFNFNGGKFNNDATPKVLSYTMYNSELSHTFDITKYYGALSGSDYNSKGLNINLTKTDSNGIQYRFLGYSLNPNATVPDANFDVYAKDTRIENYTIKDNTTLYAVWEPVLQMTVQLSVPSNPGTIVLTDDVAVNTALGNFKILSGTKNTDLLSSGTASVNSATIGVNVTNEDLVSYTVTAKGASNIKFGTAADSRILDIYNHGKNNPWFDNLNEVKDFNYSINDFTSATSSFTIPQYLGTTQSYQTSNPDLASGTAVYGIMFTCTQPSYYYKKYWNSDESTSVYCILFLNVSAPGGSTGGGTGGVLPPYAVEDGMYDFQTMLN